LNLHDRGIYFLVFFLRVRERMIKTAGEGKSVTSDVGRGKEK